MKMRTHITIDIDILGKATEDAKRLGGLSMSAYVGLLMLHRQNKLKEDELFWSMMKDPTKAEIERGMREIVDGAAKNLKTAEPLYGDFSRHLRDEATN